MDAQNRPVLRAPKEIHSSDTPIQQKAPVETDEDRQTVVTAPQDALDKDYQSALAFNEQPVTIRLERSGQRHAPMWVEVFCNGKPAEWFLNGRWVEARFLPVGVPVTTKRKYVEILARSKVDEVTTQVQKLEDHERNLVNRLTSAFAPFSVLEDKDPRGAEWLSRLVYMNA